MLQHIESARILVDQAIPPDRNTSYCGGTAAMIDAQNEKWLASVDEAVEELSRVFEERSLEARKILATMLAWSDIALFRAGLLKLNPDMEREHRLVSERIRDKCQSVQRHMLEPLTDAELKAAIIELDISSEKKRLGAGRLVAVPSPGAPH